MAQKLLSISLGSSSAKLAVISKASNKVVVYDCFDVPLPENVCDDGVILDIDALAGVLRQQFLNHRIKTKKLVFVIGSKRIASKEAIIPYVKEKQIKGILKINAPEYFPISNIEDYVLNYSIIEIVKNADKTQYRLNVTATPNEMLLGYKQLAEKLKCDIDTIDYAGNAVLQMIKHQTKPGEICAFIQFGLENVAVNIMNGPTQVMQRTVGIGLKNLVDAVCYSLRLDEEDAVAFLEDNDIERIAASYPDVKETLGNMTSSINRIFDFYNGRAEDRQISDIKYLGDATYINGLDYAIENRLGYYAEEIKKLSYVDIKSKTVTVKTATNYMANIGAVLKPMDISYEGPSEKGGGSDGKLPIWSVVVAVIVAAVLLGITFGRYYVSQKKYNSISSQIENLQPMREIETELDKTKAVAEKLNALYDATTGPNDKIAQLVDDLEKILPDTMNIDAISIDNGVVTLSGGCTGKKQVAAFASSLKELDYIDSVTIDYIAEVDEGLNTYADFTMKFEIGEGGE